MRLLSNINNDSVIPCFICSPAQCIQMDSVAYTYLYISTSGLSSSRALLEFHLIAFGLLPLTHRLFNCSHLMNALMVHSR